MAVEIPFKCSIVLSLSGHFFVYSFVTITLYNGFNTIMFYELVLNSAWRVGNTVQPAYKAHFGTS